MTAFEMESSDTNNTDIDWEANVANLRRRFPDAGSDGILFCVHKLQQDPDLSLRDFRDEAKLHGLTLGGRSLHSAKVLLGLEQPAVRRTKKEMQDFAAPSTTPSGSWRTSPAPTQPELIQHDSSMELDLIQAVQQIQESATAEAQKLRTAMTEAIRTLREAMHGRPGDED